ncbi:MAG: hypothetical protein GX781_05935 [Clostridiales bacterium]|nr:hypothetical protein [Clostridiales bacterium]
MKLNQLPHIAEEMLGGLTADQALFEKILSRGAPKRKSTILFPQRILAFVSVLVLLFGIGALSLQVFGGKNQSKQQFKTQAAGILPQVAVLRAGNLPQGSINLGKPGAIPNYKGVWARSQGGNFPLIRTANGGFYRLLNNPTSIDEDMLGAYLGHVEVFNQEPALDSSSMLLSNVATIGTQVFQIAQMEGSALAAEVEGKLRVFQRVSFSGNALLGSESLPDTLKGPIAGLQLSGVGTVTDAQQVSMLMSILLNDSSYKSSSTSISDQALLIQYSNGIILQMSVKGNSLIACGTWSNPEFIEAFKATVK